MIYHTGSRDGGVTHWRTDGDVLYFGWHESMQGTPLPAKMNRDMLVPLINAWLKDAEYGEEPDIDGSTVKGWTISNRIKYEVKGQFYITFAVYPTWLEYGK
jgi:hypothetical protein